MRTGIGIALFFFIASTIAAERHDAQTLLNDALARLKNTSYHSRDVREKGSDEIWHKANPDGTGYRRREMRFAKGHLFLVIENDEGKFIVSGDKAIRCDYEKQRKPMREHELRISYTSSEEKVNGKKCHVVFKRTEPEEKAFYAFMDSLLPETRQAVGERGARKYFQQQFPVVIKYSIDPKTHFLHQEASYNALGGLIREKNYGRVDLAPALPDSLFRLPLHSSFEVARNMREYARHSGGEVIRTTKQAWMQRSLAAQEARSKAKPSGPTIRERIDQNFETLTRIFTHIFAWIGGVAVLIVVILKLKDKKSSVGN